MRAKMLVWVSLVTIAFVAGGVLGALVETPPSSSATATGPSATDSSSALASPLPQQILRNPLNPLEQPNASSASLRMSGAPLNSATPSSSTVPTVYGYYTAQAQPRLPTGVTATKIILYGGTEGQLLPEPSDGIMGGEFKAPKMPSGGWGLILLNFTTLSSAYNGSGVYDVDYNVFMNDITVLFGTLPESGTSIVLKNITEYESRLVGTVPYEIRHPHDCEANSTSDIASCDYNSSISISFYPANPGAGFAAPHEPTEVIPLWNYTKINGTTGYESNSTEATVPGNTTSAILQVYPYGYGYCQPSCCTTAEGNECPTNDEFWYSLEDNFEAGDLRATEVSVTPPGGASQPLAYVLPFPYINTGGLNLYAWNPIPATYTLDNPPDEVNVTGALGFIEGTLNWTVQVTLGGSFTPIGDGSYWHETGDVLIYTSPEASGAVTTGNAPLVSLSSSAVPTFTASTCPGLGDAVGDAGYCYLNMTANGVMAWSSQVNNITGGPAIEQAGMDTSLNFANDQTMLVEIVSGSGGEAEIEPLSDQINMIETTAANVTLHTSVTTIQKTVSAFPFSMYSATSQITIANVTCPSGDSGTCQELEAHIMMNDVGQTWNTTVQTWTIFNTEGNGTYALSWSNESTYVSGGDEEILAILDIISTEKEEIVAEELVQLEVNTQQYFTGSNLVTDPNHVYTAWVAGTMMYSPFVGYFYTNGYGELLNYRSATRSVTSQYANYLQGELNGVGAQVKQLQSEVAQLQSDVSQLDQSRTTIWEAFNTTKTTLSSIWNSYNYTQANSSAFESEVNSLRLQMAALNATIGSLQGQVANYKSNYVPTSNTWLYLAIGLAVGAGAAFGAAFVAFRGRGGRGADDGYADEQAPYEEPAAEPSGSETASSDSAEPLAN